MNLIREKKRNLAISSVGQILINGWSAYTLRGLTLRRTDRIHAGTSGLNFDALRK